MEKIKILAYMDNPYVSTGFGTVSKNLLEGLHKTGKYDIVVLGINWYGDPLSEEKHYFKMFPMRGNDPRGIQRFPEVLAVENPDVLLIVNDFDACNHIPEVLMKHRQQSGKRVPWIQLIPVDGYPMYPSDAEFIKRHIDYPIMITQYGVDQLKNYDKNLEVPFVWHGIDHDNFYQLPKKERDALRKEGGLDGKFVVCFAGINQIRKQINLVIESFAMFAKDKDDVMLYLHTQPLLPYGWDIMKLLMANNIQNKTVLTKGINGAMGIPYKDMRTMYNLCDVFLGLHAGEGFGLAYIEAAACGLPIIYAQNTAPAEVLKGHGIPIPTAYRYCFPFYDRSIYRHIPNTVKAVEALDLLYREKELRKKYSDLSLKLANSGKFNWSHTVKLFDETIEKSLENTDDTLEIEEIL